MKCLVTGAAGFIGSHLVDRLLSQGHQVIGVDNFSTGQRRFLEQALTQTNFSLFERDLLDAGTLEGILTPDVTWVFHLAANADVRYGFNHPRRDIEQNLLVTSHLLEVMRKTGVRHIAFSSTGSVYGNTSMIPTPEECPFPLQTSLYATSKLASEGLISSYAEARHVEGLIFRFVSILGERYSHGHVFDFIRALKKDPSTLKILGDGAQCKSYLYVGDCIDAVLTAIETKPANPVEIYNLGTDQTVTVNESADIICEALAVTPKKFYTGGNKGWPGDNPLISLDCSKMRRLHWKPQKTIRQALTLTTEYLKQNPWLFDAIAKKEE